MKVLFLFFTANLFAISFNHDIDKSYQEALKSKRPLIIDFFGIWCPPCNELDQTVFECRGFIEKSKKFVLLKVDADLESSWKIKDRYKVGGYPTVVFTDYKGNEIYRVVGYRGEKEFLRLMDLVLKSKNKSFEKACASQDLEDTWRCAVVCSERKEVKCAEQAFLKLEKKLNPTSARYDLAKTYTLDLLASDDLKRNALDKLLSENPETPQALLWAEMYFSEYEKLEKEKPKKALVEGVLKNFASMKESPKLGELGLSHTDLLSIRASLLEKIDKKDEAKAAWKETADELEKFSALVKLDKPERGFTLERISALEASGQIEKALELSNDYRIKFPTEFTFHYSAASLMERQKKFNEAILAAKTAFEHSYGDNRIRSATLLIRLYATVPDKAEAKKCYDAVKKDIQPSKQLEVRTHRYLKKLDAEWEKLASG